MTKKHQQDDVETKPRTQRTVLHCPRCAHEFRRKYVPAGLLEEARTERDILASWLETVLWHVNNPGRAGEGMNIGDATRALHKHSSEAAHRVNPALADLYDKVSGA